jgi:hypothetical protein
VSEIDFAKRCIGAIDYGDSSILKARKILKALDIIDSKKKTFYEYSFKILGKNLDHSIRFLNMDCYGYAWKDQTSFRKRVNLLNQILEKYCRNVKYRDAMKALESLSSRPMDLYFGFDVTSHEIIFAYWLIIGGVSKSGKISFVSYDKKDVFNRILSAINAKPPRIIDRPILNIGVDITDDDLYYKVYYLCEEKELKGFSFSDIMPQINSAFLGRRFFYFFSEMYDVEGNLIKDKLFIEFLEDISNDEAGIEYICHSISRINKLDIDTSILKNVLSNCGGKVCLISFEEGNTLTFYVRS